MKILHRAVCAIVGLPGTGKTTLGNALAAHLGLGCCHTDQFMTVPWSEQADEAMRYMPVRGLVEGITVARLFRRGFTPDCVIHLTGHSEFGYSLAAKAASRALGSLVRRGLSEYAGRVLTLPARPDVAAVLRAIGAGR